MAIKRHKAKGEISLFNKKKDKSNIRDNKNLMPRATRFLLKLLFF